MAETVRARLQRVANALLAPAGLHLARRDRAFDMDGLLARAAARGVAPATIIDVGASDGIWSLRARRHFPRARFLLFEPLAEQTAALEKLRARHGFDFVAAAAGAAAGTVAFTIDPDLDGSGVAVPGQAGARPVPMETVDAAVTARGLPGPYCLKLDTHGYEIPVLTGAAGVLASAELLIIEAYNFQLTPETLRFHELCAWLEARGFRCCDLADPMRRPGDGAFWQMDLAFAPATSPLFASNRYD
jgi:FkbM family methyltransferase